MVRALLLRHRRLILHTLLTLAFARLECSDVPDQVVLEVTERDCKPSRITLRVAEACHSVAGQANHAHEVSVKLCLVPKELYEHIVAAGELKSKWRFDKQVVMGLIAAFYIGFSFTVCMVIGGQIPQIQASNPGLQSLIYGAFGFPLGLFMICVVGADLFTSNTAYMLTAVHEGRCSWWHLLKCWVLSWFANLAGSIIMANIVYA
ncbi:hypothetical protein QJQ45_022511, partial [Haematococcus lacustris]